MRKIQSVQDVIRSGLCVGCGACVSAVPIDSMSLIRDETKGIYVPKIIDKSKVSGKGKEFETCPGVGYPLNKLSSKFLGDDITSTFELGRYRMAVAARSKNPDILEHASSGGVMTEIALYLLERGYIDGVTVASLEYGKNGPRPISWIARNLEDLIAGQGSKYCPTTTNLLVRECLEKGGRYLFSGTPCQIAALRMAVLNEHRLAKAFPYTIGNFCGGFRDYRYINWLLSKHGLNPSDVNFFRFRGDGQPGSMAAETKDGRRVTEPYPEYSRGSTVIKMKRCYLCIDATAELADFACGDAWLDKYIKDEMSWSIILARSKFAEKITNQLITEDRLEAKNISLNEIIESQKSNLESKKFRIGKKTRICQLLRMRLPKWDVELPLAEGNYIREIRILLSRLLSNFRMLRWAKNKLRRLR